MPDRDLAVGADKKTVQAAPADRPAQITAAHLAKLAVVYVRQSSQEQVRLNTGSTEDQRALEHVARRWGWPESRIRVIDDDLGLSGTAMDHRTGLQSMLELIDQGRVGLVLVRDTARLSRDPYIAETFLTKATRARVLLYANGHVLDTATDDVSEIFGHRIQGLLAWFENRTRVRITIAAKAAKVRQGFAVAGPPLGYVRITRGKWVKDPDADVRDAVQRVFDLALEGQSIGKILRYFNEHHLQLPRRVGGQVFWERPARSSLANLLANPNYTADYHYRRRRTFSRPNGSGYRAELRPPSEWLVHRDHHEAYVSREQWQLIQEALRSRRPTVRPPLGRGAALLQGLVWCSACGRWMGTSYHRRRGNVRLPSYLCRRPGQDGHLAHYLVGASEVIDDVVVRHVLTSLGTVDPQSALAMIERVQSEQRAVRESQRRRLQRTEAEVLAARERYLQVGPDHPLVKADLEAAYEEAIRQRDALREDMQSTAQSRDVEFTSDDAARLAELTQRLEALWAAPTTTIEDRKQLLRLVLERVVVVTSTAVDIELDVVWTGGLRERLQVHRRTELDSRVARLRKTGTPPPAIVQGLGADGVSSATGKPISRDVVRRSLERLGLNRAAERRQILLRVRELLVARHTQKQILSKLDRELPRPHGRWTYGHLRQAVRTLQRGQRGVQGIPRLPAGLLDKPDMAEVMALVEAGRQEGKTWRAIADDLNARGLRPPRAAKFSLFQVMELARRRRGQTRSPRAGGAA